MRKKQFLLIIATLLCALILSSSTTFAAGQQVEIPYVISADGWWTGIAIKNNRGDAITDMKLSFTTNAGINRVWYGLKMDNREVAGDFTPPGFTPPGDFFTPPIDLIPGSWVYYRTELAEIAGNAQLINTLSGLFAGDVIGRVLPSDSGSVIFSHTGSEEFSVTVYIGSPSGFAFQVFKSADPAP